jgi:hypothetical protein
MATFEPGQSGNPEGRPKGIRDRRLELRGMLLQEAPELIAKVIEMAKQGDATALRLCLERIVPPVRAKDDPVSLPGIGESLADNSRVIMRLLAEGELTPDEASSILQAMAGQVRVIEATEIEQRIAALEQAAAKKGNG